MGSSSAARRGVAAAGLLSTLLLGTSSAWAQSTGHVVVSIQQLGSNVPETIGARLDNAPPPLKVGTVIVPGRALRIDIPGVIVRLKNVANAGSSVSEDYVAECSDDTCPLLFKPAGGAGGASDAREQRGGRVLTRVRGLLQRWTAAIWGVGADRPVNVAVEGTTFSVDAGGADRSFDLVVAEGAVTVTGPGLENRRIENGRRVWIPRGGVLREASADRDTILQIQSGFTTLVVRDRERVQGGFGVVTAGGVVRERTVSVFRERVTQDIVSSGLSQAEQARILSRWRSEGRRVITTSAEALAAGEAVYREAFESARQLGGTPDLQIAIGLFETARTLGSAGSEALARADANIGICLLDGGQFERAEALLTAAILRLPREPVVLGALARLYGDLTWRRASGDVGGNLVKANEYSQRQLQAAKGKGRSLVFAASTSASLWRFGEAREALAAARPLVTATNDREYLGFVLMVTGQMAESSGDSTEGRRAYDEALDIFAELARAAPQSEHAQLSWVAALADSADHLRRIGRSAEALSRIQQALPIAEQAASAKGGSVSAKLMYSDVLADVGDRLTAFGRAAQALPLYERAVAISERLVVDYPKRFDLERKLGWALDDLGDALKVVGRRAEAIKLFERRLEIAERLAAAAPTNDQLRRDLSAALDGVGMELARLGRHAEALALHQRSLALAEELLVATPSITRQTDLTASLELVADRLQALGRATEALPLVERSCEIGRRLSRAYPDRADLQRSYTISLNSLADLLADTGRQREALDLYQEALSIRRRLLSIEPERADVQRDLGYSLQRVANQLGRLGRWRDTLGLQEEAVRIRRRLAEAQPTQLDLKSDLRSALEAFAEALGWLDRPLEASAAYMQALAIGEEILAKEPSPRARAAAENSMIRAGWFLRLTNGATEAERLFRRALASATADLGADTGSSARVAAAEIALSGVAAKEATALLESALMRLRATSPRNANEEGWCLILLGRPTEALQVLEPELARLPSSDSQYVLVLGNVGNAYLLQGRTDAALGTYRKGVGLPNFDHFLRADLDEFRRRGFRLVGVDRVRALVQRR